MKVSYEIKDLYSVRIGDLTVINLQLKKYIHIATFMIISWLSFSLKLKTCYVSLDSWNLALKEKKKKNDFGNSNKFSILNKNKCSIYNAVAKTAINETHHKRWT